MFNEVPLDRESYDKPLPYIHAGVIMLEVIYLLKFEMVGLK